MKELALISTEEPGHVSLENYQELKTALELQLRQYQGLVYTDSNIQTAVADRKALNALRKTIDDRRKLMKKVYMAPFLEVEDQLKDLVALIDEPLLELKSFLKEIEQEGKSEKQKVIYDFYMKNAKCLGGLAEKIFHSPHFYDKKWENKSTAPKVYQTAILEKIEVISTEITTLQEIEGDYASILMEKYCETLSYVQVLRYKKTLEETAQLTQEKTSTMLSENQVLHSRTLKLTGTEQQLAQCMAQIQLLGLEVEVMEGGAKKEMEELTVANFDSFVAFDIETTGKGSAESGDGPAEITEIGAVRVEHGKVVDKFSMLANPGREIMPRIARLTGITNEMVKNEPPVGEVITAFHKFVGDSILLGHNIKSFDLPYIKKAAQGQGIAFENQFFDTYILARALKQEQNWERTTLSYLSRIFHITLPSAHRAWCDAEANVGVYFKLKDLVQ